MPPHDTATATVSDSSTVKRVFVELGLAPLVKSPIDTKLLCAQRFVRLMAYGASALILALFLSDLGVSDTRIGLFMTLTLLGDVCISFLLTLFADGLGRRNILVIGSALMTASGVVFSLSGNFWVLVVASVFGVISPRYDLRRHRGINIWGALTWLTAATRSVPFVPSRNQRWRNCPRRKIVAISSRGTHSLARWGSLLVKSYAVGQSIASCHLDIIIATRINSFSSHTRYWDVSN